MRRLLEDLRRALRSLLKTPGFTATAVLILALGIGANVAIFSLVDRVLLKPLPYKDPDRLVALWETVPLRGVAANNLSAPDFLDWQREATRVASMAALDNAAQNLTGGPEPERLRGGKISWNFFQVLGVYPALGRAFLPEEDRADGPKAVILTHEFWKLRYGGDPAQVGRSIRLNGLDTQVVGVLPPGFRFQHYLGEFQVLVPMAFSAESLAARGNHFMATVARLKPGVTAASCEEELKAIAARLALANPDTNRNGSAAVVPLKDQLVRNSRGTLLMLAGAVGFVLLIACANLMNLMLARSARRQREMAIRAALGAGPGALVWTALTESLVLGLLGGVVGLLLARWTLAGLAGLLGLTAPGAQQLTMDARLILFTLALSLGAAVLFGLLPAVKQEGRHLADSLKEGKGSGTSSLPRLRGLLVASETALATALLIGAGLMLRSLRHLQTVDPGFRPGHVLVTSVALPAYRYQDTTARAAFARDLQRRLAETPGVAAAAVNDTCPLWGSTSASSYDVGGQEKVEGQNAIVHHVTAGYFRAMGIPILAGRDLEPEETDAVVVSAGFARRHFPAGDPLAGRISMDGDHEPFLPVVGVVADVHHESLATDPLPEMYWPVSNLHSGGFALRSFMVVLRTVPEPMAMVPALKQVLRAMDPDLPLGSARSMDATLVNDRKEARARSILLGSFAGLALLLAGVGIYAVISFLTALRTREIGVRVALGAQVADVVRLVVGQGLRMALAGIGAGVLASLVMARALDAQIVGVKSWDPFTFITVAGLLALVGAAACLLPAWKAARVDPMVALRDA